MKKFLAIVLAVAMMATMAVTAFATTAKEVSVPGEKVWEVGVEDNSAIYDELTSWDLDGIQNSFAALYAGDTDTIKIKFDRMKVAGWSTLGFPETNGKNITNELYIDFNDALDAEKLSISVVQTSGAGVATVTGTWNPETKILEITADTNEFAPYVDVRKVSYQIVATAYPTTLGDYLTKAYSITADYELVVLPNFFDAPAIDYVNGTVFANGTTWTQTETVLYSELLKGTKVTFQVMDMAKYQGVAAGSLARVNVVFDKFQLTEAVNFVYKTSYIDADYENVLAVVDFQAAGRIFNDTAKVTVGNVGMLANFNFSGYNSTDKFNVYFDGKLVDEEVALNADGTVTFELYHPTTGTSMLGKYVIAKAPVVVEEEPTANPEMGADSMINVAVALAAVSLAAAGFVAVKKSK